MDMPGLLATGKTFAPNYDWVKNMDSLVQVPVQISLAAVDPTLPATYQTGLLRSGLTLGKVTATGVYKEYDDADGDGTEVAAGFLLHPILLLDPFGAALAVGTEVFGQLVVGGEVDSSLVLGLDAAGLVDLQALKSFTFVNLY